MNDQTGWELGGHRRPAWWRRGTVIAGLAVFAVVALIAAGGARQDTPLAVGSEVPTDTAGGPAGWSVLDRSTDTVLYLGDAGASVRVLDVDRGRVVDEVPLRAAPGDRPFLLERVGQSVVLQADDDRAHAFGGPLPAVHLGRSLVFLPAPADRVWLVNGDSWDPARDLRVRQVDLSGRRVVRPTPVPAGHTPVGAQGDRVLLEGDAGLRWWTPSTGEGSVVPGRSALAVGRTLVVVCADDCRTVDLFDRDGRRAARLRMAETVSTAVVAPDERAIALLTQSELATAALVIVDRDAETMRSVTNGVAARLVARGLTWSPDGAWLFFPTSTGRIGVVERATGRVSVVDAEVGPFDALAAVAIR